MAPMAPGSMCTTPLRATALALPLALSLALSLALPLALSLALSLAGGPPELAGACRQGGWGCPPLAVPLRAGAPLG